MKTLAPIQELSVSTPPGNLTEWQIWSKPTVGPGFIIDLEEFFHENIKSRKEKHHAWKGDFKARPQLIRDLLPILKVRYREAAPATAKILIRTLRHFWRYLDQEDLKLIPQNITDIRDYHGARFARWLNLNNGDGSNVSLMSGFINQTRESLKQPPIYWPEMLDKLSPIRDVPEDVSIRKLYHALKSDIRTRYKKNEFWSIHITLSSLCLFLIHTGWNLETALNIDCREENAWAINHPLKENIKVLRAPKSRAGGSMQHALSQIRPEFHAYQITSKRIEHTRSLRTGLQEKLKDLIEQNTKGQHTEEIENLRYTIRSPWIYQYKENIGKITQEHSSLIAKHLYRIAVERAITDENGQIIEFTCRNFRDAWVGFAYKQSGYQIMAAQAAAGHHSVKTTQRYLNRTRWRKEGQDRLMMLQNALWGEIQNGHAIDPAALSILVEKGTLTEEERKRLSDFRNRTRMGVGCRSPFDPPPSMRTANQSPETLCEVQRCVLCPHALVFSDSLDGLARRKVEIGIIAKRMSFPAWSESSFPEEEEALDQILKRFKKEEVKKYISKWTEDFESGKEALFDQEPIVENTYE